MTDRRRALPGVGALLESESVRALLQHTPRSVVIRAVRTVVARARSQTGTTATPDWGDAISREVADASQRSLRKVINATGIVLHTNLGRAPLAAAAIEAMTRVATGYSNLEYDIPEGRRGSRYRHCSALLCELTGAEDALVVNNGAAALVLALNTVCDGREALLSRGELVEIGGSFRVHDIMAKSGARLREVGSTNRTHLADYEHAAGDGTGAILKVHRSNFAQEGFVAETSASELVPLASSLGVPIVHDLGSGLMISLEAFGLRGEPTAGEALAAGASVVVMSGDKLLGGPQAGIILGAAKYLAAMRVNPLARSYRVDKLTLAALEATLALYRDPVSAMAEIPALSLLGATPATLRERAARVSARLDAAAIGHAIVDSESSVGAGAFPSAVLPSVAIALVGNAERWATGLRAQDPAVVGRIRSDVMLLDLRAVDDTDADLLADAIIGAHA